MQTQNEKRDFVRMSVDCDIRYKLANSTETKIGRCTTLSGAGVSFISDTAFDAGLAMEISISPLNPITPPMIASIAVVRSIKRNDGSFEIAAKIQSIKPN